ncbi:hypothetical protein NRB20_75350 [Nocardia sp. RB20]|uniref:Uncharacterized protein n=1 Tax=Nocardia macrotermitis TaxID=2585198 RepID=A0A7K0DF30_9NOCA|nr:hypothetical protein [Nocardia macrotermitis]
MSRDSGELAPRPSTVCLIEDDSGAEASGLDTPGVPSPRGSALLCGTEPSRLDPGGLAGSRGSPLSDRLLRLWDMLALGPGSVERSSDTE